MSILDTYFDSDTMSVHFKVGVPALIKSGKPGAWKAEMSGKTYTQEELVSLANSLLAEVQGWGTTFLEIDKQYSKVLQLGTYRVVIVYAPLVDAMEITVVRPVRKMSLQDYNLPEDLKSHILKTAQWILVSGAPGEGKTTFAQALAESYVAENKIVKTLESPRDLLVPDAVSQYSFNYASHNEMRDILLLSRPDYAIYDEVRNAEDFVLYADLRLTGIGLVGVTHATKAVDSIQRFIWHVDMWSLPQVIDTVIFIKAWQISEVLTVEQVVKVPAGMNSQDLARPVLQITSFLTKKILYEIYSFGEQVVVMDLSKIKTWWADGLTPMQSFAAKYIEILVDKYIGVDVKVKPLSDTEIDLQVDDSNKGIVIGKGWEAIMALEKKLWLKINVKSKDGWDSEDDEVMSKPKYRPGRADKRAKRR
jgi:ATPase